MRSDRTHISFHCLWFHNAPVLCKMSCTTDRILYIPLKLSSLSRLFNNPSQTGVHPLPPTTVKSITTHLCQCHGDSKLGALNSPCSLSAGGPAMGICLAAEKTCAKLNSPLGWLGVTRPALPACSFIIPGQITDWMGCLVCLMPAQLLHGRNGLVTLCYNTLYYHLHFIYLTQISRQATHPLQPPKRHWQFTTAQPSASVRKLVKITCLKFSLKCHLDATPMAYIGSDKGDLNCSFSSSHLLLCG